MLTYEEFIEKRSLLDNTYGEKEYAKYTHGQKTKRLAGETAPPENNPNYKGGLYIPMPFEKLEDPTFRKRFNSCILLYMYIRRYIVRKPDKDDKLDIYNRYYKSDNRFACTLATRRLVKDFGCSSTTINNYIKELVACGFLQKEIVKVPGMRPQNVYIFGGYEAGVPKYFIDEVATPETGLKNKPFNNKRHKDY